jgi:hypothetical protein
MSAFKVETKNALDARSRALGMRSGTNLALKAKAVVSEEEEEESEDWRCSNDVKYDLHNHLALAAKTF